VATNSTDEPTSLTIRYSLQKDSSLYSRPLADPVFGSNHAEGVRSWLVSTGRSSTGRGARTGSRGPRRPPVAGGHYTEALQLVDLGRVREIRKMTG